MPNLFTGWHFWVIVLIILLLFGAPRLPGLAKSLGQSMRIFKKEVKEMKADDVPESTSSPANPDSQIADDTPDDAHKPA